MKTRISYLLLVFMCFTLVLPAQTKDRISIELKGETLPTALKNWSRCLAIAFFYIQ